MWNGLLDRAIGERSKLVLILNMEHIPVAHMNYFARLSSKEASFILLYEIRAEDRGFISWVHEVHWGCTGRIIIEASVDSTNLLIPAFGGYNL